MARVNAIYQGLSDEVGRTAVSVTSDVESPDPDYKLVHLFDENPAQPAKLTAVNARITLDFGSPQRVDIVSLIHTTLDAGYACTIEANSSNSWGGPAFSASYVTPPWLGTGTRLWPVNGWLDLTEQSGYSPLGWQYWSWNFSGTNSQPIWIGQMWMGSVIRRFVPNLSWGLHDKPQKLNISNETAYGVQNKLTRGTTIWAQEADLMATPPLADALVSQWYDVDGEVHPWLLIPDGTVNCARLVRWDMNLEQEIQRTFISSNDLKVKFKEAGRGLRPGV